MSIDPRQADEQTIADNFRRRVIDLDAREQVSALAGLALFGAGEAALLIAQPPRAIALVPVVASVLVFLFSTRVRIELPVGFTAPTQLAFVPLAFAAPPSLLPLLVLLALTIGFLFDVRRGKLKVGRLLCMPGNCVSTLGPAAVFVLAGVLPRNASVTLLLCALGAQFAVDMSVSTLRQLLERQVSLSEQLADVWIYGVDAGLSWGGLVVAQNIHRSPLTVLSLLPMLALLSIFARERRGRLESMVELGNAYRGTALVLGDVVEADDGYTGQHCRSVVALALTVGEEFGLGPARRRNLEFGALLHDVGKIAIPKEIINKPGKLEPGEWTIIKTHTLEGQKMLDRVGGFMHDVGLIVRSHHERWDGGGYPDGLTGPDIPLEARIIACCDTWNAMRTDRAYRSALSYEAAMAELTACTGTQLDPEVVRALVRVVEREERPRVARVAPVAIGGSVAPEPRLALDPVG